YIVITRKLLANILTFNPLQQCFLNLIASTIIYRLIEPHGIISFSQKNRFAFIMIGAVIQPINKIACQIYFLLTSFIRTNLTDIIKSCLMTTICFIFILQSKITAGTTKIFFIVITESQ